MQKQLKILSIDGGGIRGILPGMLLASLERTLQEMTGDPRTRLADHFDLLAGTSTGGILTCLYLCPDKSTGRPRFTGTEAVDLYLNQGKEIFKSPATPRQVSRSLQYECKYVVKGMSQLLHNYFSDLKLSELIRPCLITSYDMEHRRSFFFTQHDAARNLDYDFYVKDIARATSAAPGYFEPAQVRSMAGTRYTLLDGGVFANNPALCAYAEAMQLFGQGEAQMITPADIIMISIGSGIFSSAVPDREAMQPMDHVMAGVTETVDFQMKQLFQSAGCPDNYFRFEPDLGNASDNLDDCSADNLQALYHAGRAASERYSGMISRIAGKLLGYASEEDPVPQRSAS